MLPAELPIDASSMFSEKLVHYIKDILQASRDTYDKGQ
jgi:hypothetical protein